MREIEFITSILSPHVAHITVRSKLFGFCFLTTLSADSDGMAKDVAFSWFRGFL